jgi:hypothetical protein
LSSVVETTCLVARFSAAAVGPSVTCGQWAAKDLVRLAAQEQVEGLGYRLVHAPPHEVVPVVDRPAAVDEAAGRVLLGPAGACITPSSVRKW